MTNAERLRDLRAKAKADGKCGECRARPPVPGRVTCQVCLDRQEARREAYKEADLCSCGAEPEDGKRKCRRCLNTGNVCAARRRASRVSDGVCSECGAPRVPGRKLCQSHLDATRVRTLEVNRRQGMAARPCGTCEITGHNSRSCARYHELAKAWAPAGGGG